MSAYWANIWSDTNWSMYDEWWNIDHFITDITYLGQHIENGCHFVDDIFKYIFVNENVRVLIQMALKVAFKFPISNKAALV